MWGQGGQCAPIGMRQGTYHPCVPGCLCTLTVDVIQSLDSRVNSVELYYHSRCDAMCLFNV